jgi:hypothetical protein
MIVHVMFFLGQARLGEFILNCFTGRFSCTWLDKVKLLQGLGRLSFIEKFCILGY